jgi:hypothetical protein
MSRHAIGAAFIILVFASAGSAQQGQGRGPTPAPAEKPPAPQGQSKPTPAPAEAPAPPGQPVNVKLDLTITDQMGPGEPAKKTVSMIVADRMAGSIRSIANTERATLNVDATPQILQNGNVRLQLGLEYNPRQSTRGADKVKGPSGETLEIPREPGGSSLNQRVAIVLEPNKPLILSQAADPLSDRKITVEVRVSILK